MKILFVNSNIGYGGASKMIAFISNILSMEHDVQILTFRSEQVEQDINKSVSIIYNKLFKSRLKVIELIGQIFSLHYYIKKNSIDLVIAFLHPANFMCTLAAKGTNAKVLLSERGDPYSRIKNGGLYIRIVEKIIQKADAYVFQSEGAKKAYPAKCQAKGIVIPNPIPNIDYPTYSPDEFNKTIVNVARLEVIQKRQDVIIDAFYIFQKVHPDYRLCLVGDGPDMDMLKSYVREKGLEDKVIFCGARKDVLMLLSKASIFVLSSDYEGIPNALLEAQAVGVPCVSTDCSPGGARMIIEDGVNGFIVPCNDYETMAEKLIELANSKFLRNQFSKNSKLIFDKFGHERIAKQWMDFINNVGLDSI